MAKRKKKPLIVRLALELDGLVKTRIYERDLKEFGDKCSLCGNPTKKRQWSHLISGRKHSVRWNPINIFSQCRGCNIRHEHYPEYYTAWWIRRYGEANYQDLVRLSQSGIKWRSMDLRLMIEARKIDAHLESATGVTPSLTREFK